MMRINNLKTRHLFYILQMLKENLEQIANKYYEDIVYILKANDEQYTENNTGYFFDITKLKAKTIEDLELFIHKKPDDEITEIKHEKSFSLQQPEQKSEVDDDKKQEYVNPDTKTEENDNITNFTPSQKFLSEYHVDLNKTTDKASTLLKFLNAKKKYIRNPETLLSKNEAQLMKQAYVM